MASNYMWLADYSPGLVSKFDANTGQELARYRSVINVSCAEGESPGGERDCQYNNVNHRTSYSPSRTAIDRHGNAWVGNRGAGNLSSVTKIAAEEADCVDRNGNGQIDTSRAQRDAAANLSLTVLDDDECVLFSTPVCSGSYGARALAISRGSEGTAGDVWVGCYDENTAYQLNSANGRIVGGPIPLGLHPYGAIADARQRVWFTAGGSSTIQGIDTATREVLLTRAFSI